MKVLVVDDAPANRQVLVALLRHVGHDAAAAAGVSDAVRLFQESRPDAVLTDLHLGDGPDGVELAALLRRLADGKPVRIGLMTGDARVGLAGAEALDAVLEKPVGLVELQSFLKGT